MESRSSADPDQPGVGTVAISRMGRAASSSNNRRPFRNKVKRRTGSEGWDQPPQAKLGRDRTQLTRIEGALTWWGHGVFAHRLVKLSTFTV